MLWNEISNIQGMIKHNSQYGEMYFLPVPGDSNTFWLIGRYSDQTKLATDIRNKEDVQNFIGINKVRFGFRSTDIAPVNVERQARYGNTIMGKSVVTDFTSMRINQQTNPVKQDQVSINRKSDREENVRLYWATQTPQSHHIVEFNNLRDIGASNEKGAGELDHGQLPCVLLSAEFHQRYISSALKPYHGLKGSELRAKMYNIYSTIYKNNNIMFEPLWKVSEIIFKQPKVLVK